MGGFKINGPPEMGKGPMSNEKELESSTEASLPKPTQAGRIETCTELIRQVTKCLENNDKQCTMRKIEYLIKNQCHDGRVFGRGVADKIKDVVHELWLASSGDNEFRCGLLRMLKSLNVSKRWVRDALHINAEALNTWFVRCGIDWENKAVRYEVVKEIEDLLRERFGWVKVKMCEETWRFIDVHVNAFRRHGVEPCAWLEGLESLSDLRSPYWFGLAWSDLAIDGYEKRVELALGTTNSVDAIFFPTLLKTAKAPSLVVERKKSAPAAKYVSKSIGLTYYVDLSTDKWPWPIGLDTDELERILNGFGDEELAEFIAGEIDGDGTVWYEETAYVGITACKNCPKRMMLDVLKEIIAERFGIVGTINQLGTTDALVFRGKNAVKLLRLIRPFVHHPLRRLRIELILAYRDRRISHEEFERLYEQTEYERGRDDIKRNRGLEVLARAAPQTHTHQYLSYQLGLSG
jgi:hypothetical protein